MRTPLTITFAEVATHNHFVLDRGGKVFKQTAPIIKLPESATEDDHLALLAYLNSSTACFWMKQVCYPKSTHSEARPEKGIPEDNRYAFAGTALSGMPLPSLRVAELARLARRTEQVADERRRCQPDAVVRRWLDSDDEELKQAVVEGEKRDLRLLHELVGMQENIDWFVYGEVGLVADSDVATQPANIVITPAERPFARDEPPDHVTGGAREIWLARRQRATSATAQPY